MHQLGVISDTHGLLRPEAIQALQGSELILHLGDIGKPEILDQLETIAPLHVVRGNIDRAEWCNSIPYTEVVDYGGHYLYLIHILQDLDLDPEHQGSAPYSAGIPTNLKSTGERTFCI